MEIVKNNQEEKVQEVKDVQEVPEKKPEKLTYEQLESYAQQVVSQAKRLYEENMQLKAVIEKVQYQQNLEEVKCAIKCLEHAEFFSPDFINKIVTKLEEVLSPDTPEGKEPEEEK